MIDLTKKENGTRVAILATFKRRSTLITLMFVVILALSIFLMNYFIIVNNYELLTDVEMENARMDIKNVASVLDAELNMVERIIMQQVRNYTGGALDVQAIGGNLKELFDAPCGVALLKDGDILQRYAVNIDDTAFGQHLSNVLSYIRGLGYIPDKQVYFFAESFGSKLAWLDFVRVIELSGGEQLVFIYKIDNGYSWKKLASESFAEYSDQFYIFDVDTGIIVPKQILMVDLGRVRQELSLGDDRGILLFERDDEYRMVAFQKSAQYPYYVFNSVPYLSLREYTGAIKGQNLLSLICAFAILAIGFLFKRIMLNPVVEIENAINHIVTGKTADQLKISSGSLFYAVSRTINAMLQMIKQMTDREYKERLLKKQAELTMLQSQINPHFLHNTFESIRALAMKVGATDVSNMTLALANYFRYSTDQKANLVPLKAELKNIENYLAIQNYRFKNRFKYIREFDDSSELMNHLINKMTLQPIVENAVYHGLEPKVGQGEITIRIMATEKRLLINVQDNGIGIPAQKLEELNEKLYHADDALSEPGADDELKSGIALLNVNQRIKLSFGEEYGLVLYSKERFGTTVEITIPLVVTAGAYTVQDTNDIARDRSIR